MQYYWLITLWDGTVIKVKPSNIDKVREHRKSGQDLVTSTRDIVMKDIKSFEQSDIPFIENALSSGLEEASRAFKEPVETDVGVLFRAVKKRVTAKRWDTHYSQIPHHYKLADEDGMVLIAVWRASHLIDYALVEDCTEDEIRRMNDQR